MSPLDPQVPPPGEEIHLPGATIQPLLLAVGISLAVVGITIGLWFLIPGLIITVLVTIRWIRDARRELSELPVEHQQQ
jgi:hypothetical protein